MKSFKNFSRNLSLFPLGILLETSLKNSVGHGKDYSIELFSYCFWDYFKNLWKYSFENPLHIYPEIFPEKSEGNPSKITFRNFAMISSKSLF